MQVSAVTKSHSVAVWKDMACTLVNADFRAVADIHAAVAAALGGSEKAATFVAVCGIDVLLARHFEGVARPWNYAEAIPETAYPLAQQALGIAAAYYEAGHTGKNIFMGGLPVLECEDYDDYGVEFTHMYFGRGERLLNALKLCALRHCLPA